MNSFAKMYFAKNILKLKFYFTVGTSIIRPSSLVAAIFDIFLTRGRTHAVNELAIKMAIETTTSCQLVQNFLVCAVETSRLHKLKSFGLIGRHSKLYCLCSRDIQNFIVCAIATFKTLLFVQS